MLKKITDISNVISNLVIGTTSATTALGSDLILTSNIIQSKYLKYLLSNLSVSSAYASCDAFSNAMLKAKEIKCSDSWLIGNIEIFMQLSLSIASVTIDSK